MYHAETVVDVMDDEVEEVCCHFVWMIEDNITFNKTNWADQIKSVLNNIRMADIFDNQFVIHIHFKISER